MLKSPLWLAGALAVGLLLSSAQVQAAEGGAGKITAVDLAPDGTRISVTLQGPVGKDVAFVMEQPYRLVIDFPNTSLGQVARKIPGQLYPVREVRMGENESRARLVADFGSTPVPPFKINRIGDRVFVLFQNGANRADAWRQGEDMPRVSAKAPAYHSARPLSQQVRPSVVVRKASVHGHLISLDLASPRPGGPRHRLVLDCDPEDLSVRNATISDASGSVKRFDLVRRSSPGTDSEPVARGPIKGDQSRVAERTPVRKFKWGMPATSERQLRSPEEKRGPFRLEELKLKMRRAADKN
jgi:hypothetical protein